MHVVVAGGTGFVGSQLVGYFCARNDRVTVVTRNPQSHQTARAGVRYEAWTPDLSRFDAVVNLAGEPIIGERWDDAVKQRLRASRIDSTRRIVDALEKASPRPKVLVNASAVGFYGDRGDELLPESAASGDDFLARLCVEWEAEARRAETLGVRVVIVRLGVVLGRFGGALQKMLPLFKLGLGGPFGTGRQWFAWVNVSDVCNLVIFAIDHDIVRGAVNAVAPQAVTNKQFAKALGRVLGRPALLPVPKFAVRAKIGEAADFLFASTRCVPEAAQKAGFVFQFPELEPALKNVLHKS